VGLPTQAATGGMHSSLETSGLNLFTLASMDSEVEARVRGRPFK
jgi:hypothetical protein